MMNKTLLVSTVAVVLTGCGGGSGSSPTIGGGIADFTMPGETTTATPAPAVGAATPILTDLSSVNPTEPESSSPYVPYIETIGDLIVPVPETTSSEITTESSFLFDTSTRVKLKVDMQDMVGNQGNLSICTDYEETDTGYQIDYTSCAVRAIIENGQLVQDMNLMNQYDAVIGVIWFKNRSIEPRYQEFVTENLVNDGLDIGWVWN